MEITIVTGCASVVTVSLATDWLITTPRAMVSLS